MAISVFLVDDEELLTESMEIILTMKGQMTVTGVAKDGKDALEKLQSASADIALVDLNMKGMGGLQLIPILKERYPEMKVLVLTTFYDNEYITEAIAGGADGYLLKDSSGDTIIHAIHQILSGQSILAAKVLAALSKMVNERPITERKRECAQKDKDENDGCRETLEEGISRLPSSLPEDLTTRELEICGLLSKGTQNQDIAKELFLAEGTVKNYIRNIYDKFGLHDRAALVLLLSKIC